MQPEQGPDKTPTRPSTSKLGSQTKILKSTPNNRGSAVRSDHIEYTGVQVSDIRPWIGRDVEKTQNCDIDSLLDVLLLRCWKQHASDHPSPNQTKPPPAKELRHRCLQAVLPICNGQPIRSTNRGEAAIETSAIRTHLQEYARPLIEKDRYKPWILAFNIVLEALRHTRVQGLPDESGDPIIFQQNDPSLIYQYHRGVKTCRKPDVVIVPTEVSKAAFEDGWATHAWSEHAANYAWQSPGKDKSAGEERSLQWTDILSVIEFKSTKRRLTQPPASYTIQQDEAPVIPYLSTEYLRSLDSTEDIEAAIPPATSAAPGSSSMGQTKNATSSAKDGSRTTTLAPTRRSTREVIPPARALANLARNPGGAGLKRKSEEQTANETSSKRGKIEPQPKPPKKPIATVQTAIYVAEMFAAHLGTNHLINLIIVGTYETFTSDDTVWVWLYDRQNPIQCTAIDFIQNLPCFLVLLFCLQRLSLANWGRNTLFKPISTSTQERGLLVQAGGVELTLHLDSKERVTHLGVNGRATNVFRVTSPQLEKQHPGKEMVAKVFWPEDSRTSEPALLERVEQLAQGNPKVEGHIPELLFWHKFENSTAELREALGLAGAREGSRSLYILVFPKLLPITELSGDEFLSAWWDCVLCHRELWEGGIHHRDISAGNLMYYRDQSGRAVGVLNDFDLATLAENEAPSGNQRTGTVPFMARALLTPKGLKGQITHTYRHEAESFVWVLVWVCLRFREGQERRQQSRHLDEWLKADEETCRDKKNTFINEDFEEVTPSPSHERNWRLAMSLMNILHRPSRPPSDSDDEEAQEAEEERFVARHDEAVFKEFEVAKEKHAAWVKRRAARALAKPAKS
ncbi:hypothetical protein BV22DRAFT_1198884 [Leucogyrophana mollusca]|uniref:Uncharacterized protein n=1 Tax=Leucogyrophana mollusca TaxID=85980 RepID=A0ACB8B3U0_9AGAM|nr:hypothetical protein BV22DRAFT_1198884 [Leucogyrophana mollusca]